MSREFIERPGVLSESEAWPILEAYVPGLLDDFHDAWDWVQAIIDQDSERRATLHPSTQAAMVFDRFVALTSRRLDGDCEVRLRRHGRMLRALIAKRVALRFKKLTKSRMTGHLRAGQIKTNAQSLIFYQLGIDGMEDAHPTEVTFGYTTDETHSAVTGLYITCPISWYTNKWTRLLEGGEGGMGLPFAVPVDPDQPMPEHATVLITSKAKRKKEPAQG